MHALQMAQQLGAYHSNLLQDGHFNTLCHTRGRAQQNQHAMMPYPCTPSSATHTLRQLLNKLACGEEFGAQAIIYKPPTSCRWLLQQPS